MRAGNFYPPSARKTGNAKKQGFVKAFLLAGLFTMAMPLVSMATAPTVTSPQVRPVCGNNVTDISQWLGVIDPDLGDQITWDVFPGFGPSNGTINGLPATATAGSTTFPSGVTYTPDPGFVGTDNFTILVDDGTGNTALIVITVQVGPSPSLTLVNSDTSICSGITTAVFQFAQLHNIGADTTIINTVGAQSWTVPAGVAGLSFEVNGASGGNDNFSGAPNPGKGGRVTGKLAGVNGGQVLNINVGGRGNDGSALGAAGGVNGGGDAFAYGTRCGGAGGGASDIRIGGVALGNRIVVAGGGAGNGADVPGPGGPTGFAGGNGGGLTGGNSTNNIGGSHAGGGTQFAGGAPSAYSPWAPASFGTLGNGGDGSTQGVSGGGGGGYYGGGGGVWTGGGGGSSYTSSAATSVTHTQGVQDGDGLVKLFYTIPGTYVIEWEPAAITEGFMNPAGPIPANFQFAAPVPEHAAAGTYHGVLKIRNTNTQCEAAYNVSVTVKVKPVVDPVADQYVCGDGAFTSDVPFSGNAPSSSDYKWTNYNPAIGIPVSGEGHIPPFALNNPTYDSVVANITVIPMVDGCSGDSVTFRVVDHAIPALGSTPSPAPTCDNAVFNYTPTSLTSGTQFAWTRDAVAGINDGVTAASGMGNPAELLDNTTDDPISVAYVYTLTAYGCTNPVAQTVNVLVNSTPVITSTHTPNPLCNGDAFDYTVNTNTTAADLTWTRAAVSGISNPVGNGTGDIHETLVNTTATPKAVNYAYTMDINGCIYHDNITVTVNPNVMLTSPLVVTAVCDSAHFTYDPLVSVPGSTISWTRAAVTGINNPARTNTDGISEWLDNTTPDRIPVTYTYTLQNFGCTRIQNVVVTVNPSPMLTSTLTPTPVCTNTLFNYTPSSSTADISDYVWGRDNVTGISNPAALGHNSVSEILVNSTDLPIDVPYLYTLFANGCAHTQTVTLRVNPTPRLSSDISNVAVCDSSVSSFVPASFTPGATFTWSRAYEAGISNVAAIGSGAPAERLKNTTYINVTATYVYTITANGCGNTQSVPVVVRPSPVLSTSHNVVTCTSAPFTYMPLSYTPLTTFAWSRATTSGITPATASGTGSIVDTLTQTTLSPMTVTYTYTLTVSGCSNKQTLTVTVNPGPATPVIATHPASSVCANSHFVNFGADVPATNGLSYSWSSANGNVVSVGGDGQYCIVNFNNAGDANVILTAKLANTTCVSKAVFPLTVTGGNAETPGVIYFNGQFICQQTQLDGYQWGYDNASNLDSNMVEGETNQNYANGEPDWNNRYYWVMTMHNGCTQKTYYNRPTGIVNVDAANADMKVFPNPADNYINVEITTAIPGDIHVDVVNMLGQKLSSVLAQDRKARISVAELPAGCYIVDCYRDGVKIAAARFIKN